MGQTQRLSQILAHIQNFHELLATAPQKFADLTSGGWMQILESVAIPVNLDDRDALIRAAST